MPAPSGLLVCPYCKASVRPLVGPDGRKLCPSCRNTGRLTPAAGPPPLPPLPPAPPPPASSPQRPTVPGAVPSLVLGIIGVLTGPLGLLLGIIAIVLGRSAKRKLRDHPGQYGGDGLASTGQILGIVAIVLGVVTTIAMVAAFAAVFALISELEDKEVAVLFEADEARDRLTVADVNGTYDWSAFEVSGTAGCVLPEGSVEVGDVVLCANDGTVEIRYVGYTGDADRTVFSGAV